MFTKLRKYFKYISKYISYACLPMIKVYMSLYPFICPFKDKNGLKNDFLHEMTPFLPPNPFPCVPRTWKILKIYEEICFSCLFAEKKSLYPFICPFKDKKGLKNAFLHKMTPFLPPKPNPCAHRTWKILQIYEEICFSCCLPRKRACIHLSVHLRTERA